MEVSVRLIRVMKKVEGDEEVEGLGDERYCIL
jgi:hypothetical protein